MLSQIKTMALARACMTGDAERDCETATTVLRLIGEVEHATWERQGEVGMKFLRDLAVVGFYKSYGQMLINTTPGPKLCTGVEYAYRRD